MSKNKQTEVARAIGVTGAAPVTGAAMHAACIEAVKADGESRERWSKAGPMVRAFYGTESALAEAKAQFIADAILPALDPRHAKALEVDLPRKGSKDYAALDAAGLKHWEDANKAKIDARATAHTYYNRIVSYAFPKEKKESTTLKTKLCNMLADAIKKCEKAEEPDFDVAGTLTHLRAALAMVAK